MDAISEYCIGGSYIIHVFSAFGRFQHFLFGEHLFRSFVCFSVCMCVFVVF